MWNERKLESLTISIKVNELQSEILLAGKCLTSSTKLPIVATQLPEFSLNHIENQDLKLRLDLSLKDFNLTKIFKI